MSHSDTSTEVPQDRKFLGFISASTGVAFSNLSTFYWACLTGILLAAFTPQLMPYLLTEFLHIPESEQGVVSGSLTFYGEITIILTTGLWGVLSDKFGRRPLMTASYLIIAISMYLFPRVSDFSDLVVARIIFAMGIGCFSCLIITLLADYVADHSRGKAAGMLGISNGLGALISVIFLLQLPAIFQQQGMSVIDAGIRTYDLAALIAVVTAVIMWLGLQKIEVIHHISGPSDSLLGLAGKGLRAAKDPGIRLAYASAFIARGNVALVGTFFTLWLMQHGVLNEGMSSASALAKAGMVIAVAQSISLLSAPIFGLMTDRLNRVTALTITLGFAFVGYCGTYLVSDPFGPGMLVCAALIGMAEVGCIITSAVLISQQAPLHIRGSVMGFFNLCGGVGILISSIVGGYLFDAWIPQGPFVFLGFLSLLVFIWSLIIKNKIIALDDQADPTDH